MILFILTCRMVVPGSTMTGLSSMNTSIFSGALAGAAAVPVVRMALLLREVVPARINARWIGTRNIFT